jgi:hypothetical protein
MAEGPYTHIRNSINIIYILDETQAASRYIQFSCSILDYFKMKRRGKKKLECHQYAALDVSKHFSSSPDVSLCVYPIDGQAKKKKQDDKIVNSSFSETFDRKHFFFWPPLRIHKRAGPINTRNEQTSGTRPTVHFVRFQYKHVRTVVLYALYVLQQCIYKKETGKTGNWFTLAMANITFLRKCRSGRHSMLCVYTYTVHCALCVMDCAALFSATFLFLDLMSSIHSGRHKSHSSEMSNPPFTRGERSKKEQIE